MTCPNGIHWTNSAIIGRTWLMRGVLYSLLYFFLIWKFDLSLFLVVAAAYPLPHRSRTGRGGKLVRHKYGYQELQKRHHSKNSEVLRALPCWASCSKTTTTSFLTAPTLPKNGSKSISTYWVLKVMSSFRIISSSCPKRWSTNRPDKPL